MVFKVSKGGVRSGNTLRGLRTHRTRRYSRQACVVGRSNLNPKDISTFVDSFTEDNVVRSTLGSTDVVLSLNKKQRWLLPATVSDMIKTGNCSEGKTMVSLLERHKLKRRANCVSFVCNQGRLRHVALKQKRYFSFNLDNIDSDQSNRQKKREKAKLLKGRKQSKLQATEAKQNAEVKIINAFSVSGFNIDDRRRCLDSSKPEYRLEVFYPCSQSCSLVYNPKYTNAPLKFEEEGNTGIKSSTKYLKGKSRHRKQFTTKDLKIYQADMDGSDSTEFLYDDINDLDSDSEDSDTESSVSLQDSDSYFKTNTAFMNNKDAQNETYETGSQITENILASLISQAENARSLCDNDKLLRRRRKSSSFLEEGVPLSISEDKSHIVYTSDRKYRLPYRKKRSKKGPIAKTPLPLTANYMTLQSSQVILTSAETRPDNLRARFGHFYAEAESEPRRFVINVTEDIQNLLSTSRNTEQNAVFTSFLIFVYDGVYDEGLDTYKVTFNSNTCTETQIVNKSIAFERTSIEEIVNRVACVLLDMKQENLLCMYYTGSYGTTSEPVLTFVNDLMRVDLEIFRTSDEIRRASQTNAIQENANLAISLNNIVRDVEFEIFCDICYENINSAQAGAVSGTKLSRCSHNFCDECWRLHFRAKLKNGVTKIVCPGYGCEEIVGPVTLLSLLHVSEVSQLFQRMCEEQNESSQNSRWCPNPGCGRIIRLGNGKGTSDVSLDVTCVCGHEFCFSCQSQPHWPATCVQAGEYHGKLHITTLKHDSSNSPPQLPKESTGDLEIEGRLCPNCLEFIDKNGGGNEMTCKCGYEFCWNCLHEWGSHAPDKCRPNATVVLKYTRKMKIRHLVAPKLFNAEGDEISKKPDSERSRQKATMYHKALHERQDAKDFKHNKQIREMGRKIACMSKRDIVLKREVLSICGVNIDETSLDCSPVATHVTKFLRTCVEIKRALHHVTEYTFVLLRDIPDSVDKRRAFRLATDLSGYCIFIKSILELGQHQDLRAAIKRLGDIQKWAKGALNVLLSTVGRLKY